ncbi:MAG: hypothetical protein ACYSUF_00150 [Planctomycetota bacterium]|jgi:hypothetical protein
MSRAQRVIASLLTVNALLLAGLVWVQIAERPLLATPAVAQQRSLPNAGGQRDQMVALLNEIRKTSEATRRVLETGRVRVEVVAPSTRKSPQSAPRSTDRR